MTDREATTTPCSAPHSDTLPSGRIPNAPRRPTIVPPPMRTPPERKLLHEIRMGVWSLNLAFWLLTLLAVARSCH